jgi:hypothetical protein
MRRVRLTSRLLLASIVVAGCRGTPAPIVGDTSARSAVTSHASWVRVDAPGSKGSQAVLEGGGALVAGRRYELIEGPAARWSLSRGPLGKSPIATRLPFLDDCAFVSIAAFDTHLTMSCEPKEDAKALQLHVTDVEGVHREELDTLCGEGRWNRLWPASPEGALVVEGGCLPDAEDSFGSMPPILRTTEGVFRAVDDRTAPNAVAPIVFALRWSPRGDLYALCDDRAGEIFLLVSTDDGATFRHHTVPPITHDGVIHEPRLDHVGTLQVEDDGRVVVVIREIERDRWIRYDSRDYGQTLLGAPLTIEAESLDLAGVRGFAYTDGGDAWETKDAGVTWNAVPKPPVHPEPENQFERRVACSSGGCLVDRSLARVGWEL